MVSTPCLPCADDVGRIISRLSNSLRERERVGLATRSVHCYSRSISMLKRQDRRPLSPPPILRLWVRDANGQLVDPRYVGHERSGVSLTIQSCQHQFPGTHGRPMVGRCGAAS